MATQHQMRQNSYTLGVHEQNMYHSKEVLLKRAAYEQSIDYQIQQGM